MDPTLEKAEEEAREQSEAALEQRYRDAAAGLYGEVEIDADAKVSHGDDAGAYVQAWVWVPEASLD